MAGFILQCKLVLDSAECVGFATGTSQSSKCTMTARHSTLGNKIYPGPSSFSTVSNNLS